MGSTTDFVTLSCPFIPALLHACHCPFCLLTDLVIPPRLLIFLQAITLLFDVRPEQFAGVFEVEHCLSSVESGDHSRSDMEGRTHRPLSNK